LGKKWADKCQGERKKSGSPKFRGTRNKGRSGLDGEGCCSKKAGITKI